MPLNHRELGFCISRANLINSVNKSWPQRGWVRQGSITNHNAVKTTSHLLCRLLGLVQQLLSGLHHNEYNFYTGNMIKYF